MKVPALAVAREVVFVVYSFVGGAAMMDAYQRQRWPIFWGYSVTLGLAAVCLIKMNLERIKLIQLMPEGTAAMRVAKEIILTHQTEMLRLLAILCAFTGAELRFRPVRRRDHGGK